MKRLADLIGPEVRLAAGNPDSSVGGITLDSRAVEPGMLFAAMPGTQVDGARFVPDAIAAGAVAILSAEDADIGDVPEAVAVIRARDPRRAIALMAARYYPRQPETIVAVTGTSGKSSVADFARQIFNVLGHSAASIGTIGIVKPDGSVYGGLTTPDPISLHANLQALADDGVTHLAFEASSHGLDQRRLDGVRIKAAGFTNLGRDHLDYHPTLEDYFLAKLRLFSEVLPDTGAAVVNIGDGYRLDVTEEDPSAEPDFNVRVLRDAQERGLKTLTCGIGTGDLSNTFDYGMDAAQVPRQITVGFGDLRETIAFPLVGYYQVENAILAAGLVIAAGGDPSQTIGALAHLKGVSGRLEPVGTVNGAIVIVDYAHKPDALETVLRELKPKSTGRLVSVFGCGGDRDRGKRPLMGEISARLADITIVTDDNPRSEDPAAVRAEILAAAPKAVEIGDRGEAIRYAIQMAQPGDVVVIAGKGHETGQIVGDVVLPFSDQEVARAAIKEEQGR